MSKVLRYIHIIVLVILLMLPAIGNAGALEEYEEAHKLYLAAAACTAVYSDRVGSIARDALEQDGWKIESYVGRSSQVDARFLVAKKIQPGTTVPFYLLAAVGTENIKDIKADLRVGKVYFAGKTPEEFTANAQRKDMPDSVPKVHEGFNQYVQASLAAQVHEEVGNAQKPLLDVLLENKERKVYLVGHSLGGAGVTLGGARLLDMGVRSEQVEVITFGAPAVGNKAFRQRFDPILNVTRVVMKGDPITQVLQKLVGGYEQFGQEIRWKAPEGEMSDSHQITSYLDLAIKNYYQKRQQAVLTGEFSLANEAVGTAEVPRVYVAQLKNNLPEELQEEFLYMREALEDEYRSMLPGYVLGITDEGKDVFQKALALGCKWVVVPEIQAYKIKNEKDCFYITLNQGVYRADSGEILNAASYGSSTRNLTSLEALIHDAKTMGHDRHDWLISSQKKEEQ
ncbi:lipase family protein [Pelosinus sp. sgz500959]|uniref:lipase family protein n=1 Tax=Pelosinus sp. sgz500959 TaxID=3242472 RepID=UPI00366B43D8